MSEYSICHDEKELNKAMKLARGSYQKNILLGYEALSGATLKGRALDFKKYYQQSAQNLINRCKIAGIKIEERIGDHNKRELHIG